MSKPLLTIAMPSYNVEAYLRRGLSSLADARLDGLVEVLVVNDGSTDATARIAGEYVSKFPHIFRLINKENGGHGSAVNSGIAQARGKFFRVVDGDDWVNTEGLLRVLDVLRLNEADIVVDERCDVDMKTKAETLRALPAEFQAGKVVEFEDVCENPACEDYFTIHTMNVRTSLLHENNVRLHEGIFYVDLQYCVLCTAAAHKVEFAPCQVYYYLLGNAAQSVSYANYVKRYAHHEAMVRDVVEFADSATFSGRRAAYVDLRAVCAINTNFNIALIYDTDRKRGLARAKGFRAWLRAVHPRFYALTSKRYSVARVLHCLGFNGPALDKLMRRA